MVHEIESNLELDCRRFAYRHKTPKTCSGSRNDPGMRTPMTSKLLTVLTAVSKYATRSTRANDALSTMVSLVVVRCVCTRRTRNLLTLPSERCLARSPTLAALEIAKASADWPWGFSCVLSNLQTPLTVD